MNAETRCHGSAGRACAMPSMAAEIERLTKERNEARELCVSLRDAFVEFFAGLYTKFEHVKHEPLPWEVKP